MSISKIFISLFLVLSFSCSSQNSELNEFRKFLGEEKVKALDQLVVSFQEFLDINYPGNDLGEKTKQFLIEMEIYDNPKWEFEKENNKKILDKIEKSGLARELYTYEKEDYISEHNIFDIYNKVNANQSADTFELDELNLEDIDEFEDELLPIGDSISYEEEIQKKPVDYFRFNIYGKYLYSLAKDFQSDTLINQYIDVKVSIGDISPSLMSRGFHMNYSTEELKRPIVQYIIAVEFYFPMLEYIIKNDL